MDSDYSRAAVIRNFLIRLLVSCQIFNLMLNNYCKLHILLQSRVRLQC